MTLSHPAALDRPSGWRGTFRDDVEARAVYAEAAGIQRIWPTGVAVPTDVGDVVTLVRWAHETGTALVPRGSGSGMAGGAIGAGVIADLSRLRDRGAIDGARHLVWAGAGVLRGEVDSAAAARGLRFPVDPSSGAFCSVGGMAATNASGVRTLKYGSTRRWVSALECVFSDGTRAVVRRGDPPPREVPAVARFLAEVDPAIRRADPMALAHVGVRKDSSGYALRDYARSGELVDLLVGSEGTLALFVGVELALTAQPGATASLLATFRQLEAAVDGAAVARHHGASACELLDRTFLDLVRGATDTGSPASALPASTDAVLLIELEADDAAGARTAAHALASALTAAGAERVDVAAEPSAEAAVWALRRAASPALARMDPALKSMQVIEDGAVPPDRLAEYVRGVRDLLARHDMRGAIFGHAGDAHIHVNPLIDVRRPAWRAEIAAILSDVAALTARLGGTLTGEHGDGRLRTPLLAEMWPSYGGLALRLFGAVKAAFDPGAILNPGVKVTTPGEPLIGDVKYDSSLPPLPEPARRALDRVADAHAYATPRLDLLDGAPAHAPTAVAVADPVGD